MPTSLKKFADEEQDHTITLNNKLPLVESWAKFLEMNKWEKTKVCQKIRTMVMFYFSEEDSDLDLVDSDNEKDGKKKNQKGGKEGNKKDTMCVSYKKLSAS